MSEIWRAGHKRLKPKIDNGKKVIVLYLGDHDPSGIDMGNDVRNRLMTFTGASASQLEVRRIALTMDQIEEYAPPPNPTKLTDSRAGKYIEDYGHECWELDALEPTVIRGLIQEHIDKIRNKRLWQDAQAEERVGRENLQRISDNWSDVVDYLEDR